VTCPVEAAGVVCLASPLQTCTALHELSDHEQVWQSVATACWRQLAAVGTSYRTFKVSHSSMGLCNQQRSTTG
jgi:hypothetical protein